MDKIFIDYKENEHLDKYLIVKKEEYYSDLDFIDNSLTGRVDAQIANKFIYEAKYLVVNAIKLFEMGYFDCAYYSLREAIEMSTIMIYFSDIPKNKMKEKLKDWVGMKKFPMRNEMIKYLKCNGEIFIDFRNKLSEYFENAKSNIEILNKYAHKQGVNRLYTLKKFYDCENKIDDEYYIKEFEKLVEFTIGYVAIMRLSIDPLPLMLMDEDLYYRSDDLLTEPYTEEFIAKYIEKKYLKMYKDTELYKGYEKYFMLFDKQNIAISNIKKDYYVDISEYNDIKEQYYLLDNYQKLIVEIFRTIKSSTEIYYNKFPIPYFSNVNSKRKKYYYDFQEFQEFYHIENQINMKYNGVYMSIYTISNNKYFIVHNEILSDKEIEKMNILIEGNRYDKYKI